MASLLPFSLLKPTTFCKASSTSTQPTSPSLLLESLNDQFGRKGIKFLDSADTGTITPAVELSVRNGSSLKLQIPNAHVTSYRPKVYWKDDGFEEVLYTLAAPSKGGVALLLNDVTSSTTSSVLSGCEWFVKDADSDSFDAVQVELSCKSGALEITYIVSLYLESMASAVIVKNNGKKPVKLTSAILSHFKFTRRSGSGIQGLKGCSYCSQPPLSSPFELLSPSEAMKADDPGFFSMGSEPPNKPGQWTTQDEPITVLKDKMSRVYTAPPSERSKPFYRTPPSKYEIIDQGKELFYRVIRMGYDDIIVSSPGSYSNKYGRDYFICTGPASMLVPVIVDPGETWRGAQVIEHDNLT
ncbi:photosynthetic NDH subunit of subcomplex B 2, chloroplastic [Silene latifolia]|uniref:photosynthetic NDH subunit of subcomplex B 2, chloroplastic n=1 Tax=Silene latifolia TaxID=37657 RepID=UPI003D782F09